MERGRGTRVNEEKLREGEKIYMINNENGAEKGKRMKRKQLKNQNEEIKTKEEEGNMCMYAVAIKKLRVLSMKVRLTSIYEYIGEQND